MQTTKQFISNELSKAQELLWSGSLHEIDSAQNIITNLINDLCDVRDGSKNV